MSEHTEGHGGAYERIRAQKSLGEILKVAASFETAAYNFYTSMLPKVGKNLRYLVEELAAEEKRHMELFTRLAGDRALTEKVNVMIQTPLEDHHFSDYVHLPDLGENPDDQAILQYALGREDAAMKQYRELADNSKPGPIRELFRYLANEETAHKRELEKRYYEIVHSGGPA